MTDSLAPSYDGKLERAFAIGAKSKKRKYAGIASELGSNVIPFIVDAFGAIEPEGLKLVKDIAEHTADALLCDTPKEIESRILDKVSVALQRGNARMIAKAAYRTLREHPDSRPRADAPVSARILPEP